MTSPPDTPSAPFSRIKIRAGALVFCGDDVALIRRDRAEPTHYTPPGGNVEPGEDLDAGLPRELAEELGLNKALAEGGNLLWVVDQRVTRTSPTPPPRKKHLVYRFHISPDVRATLAEQELDELPDGSHEVGVTEWIDYRKTAELSIFPPIGPALPPWPPAPSSPTPPSKPSPTRTTPGSDQTRRAKPAPQQCAELAHLGQKRAMEEHG
ncbi:NUDIX hydrolase [Streptomyces sp. BRB081]|uniref:NUDIX hydrolase n=1 Tax=Streptomyces sp. BRB081 TaxID=2769544 RepID=UPI001F5E044B|nr:NUDIX hydrolase [Streptomyces sp. BRB081]